MESVQSDATTTTGQRVNGHRRVSSLVREFDAQAMTATTTTTDSMPSSGDDLVGGAGTAQGFGGGGSALGVEYAGQQADGHDEDGDVFLPLSGHESGYTTAPASPAKPAVNERHARRHSRLHSRNLSVFFPRPGAAVSGSLAGYEAPSGPSTSTVPSAALNATSYGNETVSPPARGINLDGPPSANLTGRRGHHHRHSLSHKSVSVARTHIHC